MIHQDHKSSNMSLLDPSQIHNVSHNGEANFMPSPLIFDDNLSSISTFGPNVNLNPHPVLAPNSPQSNT